MSVRLFVYSSFVFATVLSATACQQEGFKPPVKSSTDFVLNSPDGSSTVLTKSPRMIEVAEAAKESSLKMELERLGSNDAKIIMSVEVQKSTNESTLNQSTVRAIVASYGMIAEYKTEIATSIEQDGQALVATDFVADKILVEAKVGVPADAGRVFQVISHCSNSCNDLFIHIQINNNNEFEAGAFYNFKRIEGSEYKIVNSSVGNSYKTLDQVREMFKAN